MKRILYSAINQYRLDGQTQLGPMFHKILRMGTIAVLLFAYFGGKYSFSRFVSETEANPWLELRLWFTVAGAVGILAQQIIFRSLPHLFRSPQLGWMLVSLIALNVGLAVHVAWFGKPETISHYIVDFAFVAVQAVLFALAVRDRKDLLALVYCVEAVGIALFGLAIAGFGHHDYGPAWAPFGTSVTFYRIEFLVVCCGLYAAAISPQRTGMHVLHFGIAAIGLFSVLASLEKAALLASTVVTFYLVVAFLIVSRPRKAVMVFTLFAVVIAVFQASFSDRISGKFLSLELGTPVGPLSSAPASPSDPTTIAPSASGERANGAQLDPKSLIMRDIVVLSDRTQRIRLFAHAWDLFWTHKIFGVGFGYYEVPARNSARDGIDIHKYPHNIVLELLAVSGIVGAALFGVAMIVGIIVLHQAVRLDDKWLFLVGYPVSVLCSSMFMGDIFDFRGFFLLCVIIAGVAWPVSTMWAQKQN